MKKHLTMGGNYLKLLEATEAVSEGKRQEQFRTVNCPKVAELQVKLLSKTPTRGDTEVSIFYSTLLVYPILLGEE